MIDPERSLRIYAKTLDDMINVRIRVNNRYEAIQRTYGSSEDDLLGFVTFFIQQERELSKHLTRSLSEAFPVIYDWADETVGLGAHTVARLIGETGHPHNATPFHWEPNRDYNPKKPSHFLDNPKKVLVADEPFERSVSQFWAYCGCGDASKRRRLGASQTDNLEAGNPRAKAYITVIAKGCIKLTGEPDKNGNTKQRSLYRDVYDTAREHYAATHPEWTPKHKDNAALRKVKKEILKDMWIVSLD